jgi:sulfotransferase family protein
MTGRGNGALPNLIVIGAQKCGTSSLHYYLDLHPEIEMSSPKELNFFTAEEGFDPEPFAVEPADRELLRPMANWSRGLEWYQRHFNPQALVRGESSPAYASPWEQGVAERMAHVVPDARLIFMVRDPIDRAVSSYRHLRALGRERRPVADALRGSPGVYLGRSSYASLLRPFLDRFPRSRILVLRQEDLLSRRRETIRVAFEFLEVEEGFWSPRMERERNVSGRRSWRLSLLLRLRDSRLARASYRLPQEAKWLVERLNGSSTAKAGPALDDETRRVLLDQLEPEIAGLEEITGWDLSEWRARQPGRVEA